MSQTQPARRPDEARMSQEGQANAGGVRKIDTDGKPYFDAAPLSEYPRMMYRATTEERVQEWADAIGELKDKPMVINRFDGLLCDTKVVAGAAEAEALASDGWDVTPHGAHGEPSPFRASATAKDDEIAALRAERDALLSAQGAGEPIRRGPGRPPRQPITDG